MHPDWYTSNMHKWAFAPKGAAFLYTAKAHQATCNPMVVSHDWQSEKWNRRFWQQGTRDDCMYNEAVSVVLYPTHHNR
jgi:selenocysteine lyase/cysteine desulfurase